MFTYSFRCLSPHVSYLVWHLTTVVTLASTRASQTIDTFTSPSSPASLELNSSNLPTAGSPSRFKRAVHDHASVVHICQTFVAFHASPAHYISLRHPLPLTTRDSHMYATKKDHHTTLPHSFDTADVLELLWFLFFYTAALLHPQIRLHSVTSWMSAL